MQTITSTRSDETIYQVIDDGQVVSFLTITTDTRVVLNVETIDERQGEGLARHLWDTAIADGEVLHQQEHHRTPEGDAFARAMGGETADETEDYCEHCIVCTGDDDTE